MKEETGRGFSALLTEYKNEIMGFAALWIFLFHCWSPVFSASHQKALWLEKYVTGIGFTGVDIFFFLSGIGMVYSIGRGTVSQFYKKRLKRLVMPTVLVAVVQALFEGWSLHGLVGVLTGYYFLADTIYLFLWFYYAILIFYLLFPLYYRFLKKAAHPMIFTGIVIAAWFVLSVLLKDTMRLDLFGFTNRIPVFLIGILFGECSRRKTEVKVPRPLIWCILAAMLAAGLVLSYKTTFEGMLLLVQVSNCFLPNLMIACSLPFFLAAFLDWLYRIPGNKIFRLIFGRFAWLGSFTYEFYAIQEQVCRAWKDHFHDLGHLLNNLIVFVLVLASGWLLRRICLLITGLPKRIRKSAEQ